MHLRASSPTRSENEYDISKALLAGTGDNCSSPSHSDGESGQGDLLPSRSVRRSANAKSAAPRPSISGLDEILNHQEDGETNEDDEIIAAWQAASNRKASNVRGRSVKKGGGFQAMGLNSLLLKAITRKGFSVPTPIQRKCIPLVMEGRDVVGMARTGSGKTAAFVVPMIDKLKTHSAMVGARALILSPSRELALQTLKVVKELGRGTDLRSVLLVGGDRLEDQFAYMSSNPDILIATPGRFLHLQVEMALDLSSVRYVVFDEADRLFEMGFAAQLTEILHALPSSRQTLLFSATLPKSLLEFARAGLQEPRLVRLDAESKISPDLESAFFTVKSIDKEGALLHVLGDVIKMPTGPPEGALRAKEQKPDSKKRKREPDTSTSVGTPTVHSTIVFAATKHHVEYIATLLRITGYAVSYAYGSLDQTARKIEAERFRSGMTNIFVVTDVAARGIDIPVLANVINYDFPSQPKVFVHRVGRTARAGKRGRAYSLVTETDAPYLLDLQLFLGRKLVIGSDPTISASLTQDVIVGSLPRDQLASWCELANKLLEEDVDLAALRTVAAKGEKLYLRTRNSASIESAKRAKNLTVSNAWTTPNLMFHDQRSTEQKETESMLARVSSFRPQETILEIGKRGSADTAAEIMRSHRERISSRKEAPKTSENGENDHPASRHQDMRTDNDGAMDSKAVPNRPTFTELGEEPASEDEIEVAFSQATPFKASAKDETWKDSEHFMPYLPTSTNLIEERGYGVQSGSYNSASHTSGFLEAARDAVMNLANDDGAKSFAAPTRAKGLRWDKKSKKYVSKANDEDGSRGAKMIKGESGQKIAASFRSGRFDAWRKSNKISSAPPRTGQAESATPQQFHKFKHRQERAPKPEDKFRDDYYKRKKRLELAKEKRIGRFQEGGAKREIKSVDDVRKQRRLKEKRREKNARPSLLRCI